MTRPSRYPGTRPFSDSDEDRRLFFGRNEETEQLFLRVLSVPLLVLFGRSGLGKTSLLRAGLFPRLRSKAYLPITVRLNTRDEPLATVVSQSIDRACEAEGLEAPNITAPDLKTLLSRITIWRGDLLLTPVLVLDQFEEVFTLHDPDSRRRIGTEIGALVFRQDSPGEDASASSSFPFKLVISLREDFLGALEEMTVQIPNLFLERMRVQPFGELAAREAIIGPAQVDDDSRSPFSTTPFEFSPELLDEMLGYLRGSFGVIEPFQLQLLCRRAEEAAEKLQATSDARVTLVPGSFGSEFRYEHVLRDFYRGVLAELPWSQRRRAARLCEEGLLDRAGHRLMLEEEQIEQEFGVRPATLNWLTQERVLLREQRRESIFYEIGHDRLAESIAQTRRFRVPRRYRRVLWTGAVVAPVLVGSLFYRASQLEEQKRRTERALKDSEQLLAFLVSENFLTTIADVGGSGTLVQVRDAANKYLGQGQDVDPLIRARLQTSVGDLDVLAGRGTKGAETYGTALEDAQGVRDVVDRARQVARIQARLGSTQLALGQTAAARSKFDESIQNWRSVINNGSGDARDCLGFARARIAQAEQQRRGGEIEAGLGNLTEALRMSLETIIVRPSERQWCSGAGSLTISAQLDADVLEVVSQAMLSRAQLLGRPEEHFAAFQLASEVRRLKPLSPTARSHLVTAQAWWLLTAPDDQGRRRLFDFRRLLRELERLQRWDRENRSILRQRGEVLLLATEAAIRCRARSTCDPPPAPGEAESLNLQALALFRWLQGLEKGNSVTVGNLGWALLQRARMLETSPMVPQRTQERLDLLREAEQQWNNSLFDGDAERDARLAEVRVALAAAEAEAGHPDKAQKYLLSTTKELRPLAASSKNPEYRRLLAQAHAVGVRFHLDTETNEPEGWSQEEEDRLDREADRLSGEILGSPAKNIAMSDVQDRLAELGQLDPAVQEERTRALETELVARIAAAPSDSGLYDLMRRTQETIARAALKRPPGERTPDQAVAAAIAARPAWSAALRSAQLAALLSRGEQEKAQLRKEMRTVGDHLEATGHPDESIPLLWEEVSLASELVEPRIEPTPRPEDVEPRPEALRVLAEALLRFAKVLESKNGKVAEEVLQRALVTANRATELDKKNREGWTLVATIALAKAERRSENRSGDCRTAQDALQKALALEANDEASKALMGKVERCNKPGRF